MSTRDWPQYWLKLMQDGMNDLAIARFLLGDLVHYTDGGRSVQSDVATVLALITAIRLDALRR